MTTDSERERKDVAEENKSRKTPKELNYSTKESLLIVFKTTVDGEHTFWSIILTKKKRPSKQTT